MQQAVGGRPPRYALAQACKWWHDIRHERIWIGHHYTVCPCWPASTTNQSGLVTLTFDLWPRKWCPSHVWRGLPIMPILVFPGLSVVDLGPKYATDRQTSDVRQHHRLMPLGGGIIISDIVVTPKTFRFVDAEQPWPQSSWLQNLELISNESTRQKRRTWMIWCSVWCVGWSEGERYSRCHWPAVQPSLHACMRTTLGHYEYLLWHKSVKNV